ncbi:MAG: Protein of unknown function (DUF1553)/Protein of unknown function (DUF1549)/Planctomycete, partial [Chthonomonadales bacterium]|nr:Protein of unknown function (DUF1553)/Protein of unknown function (DUF1549)/Planctomycete [Chthonomonadales bacterium]
MAIFGSQRPIRPLVGGAVVLSGLLVLLALGSDPVSGQNKTSPTKPATTAVPPVRIPSMAGSAGSVEFFEKSVRPILVANCYQCHAKVNEMAQGGMQLDSREGLLLGGKRGAALIPGDTAKSLLLHAISYQDGALKMPPKGKLNLSEIAALSKWIKDGAVWPTGSANRPATAAAFDIQTRKRHWAWQPLQSAKVPVVKNKTWVRNPIDNFILAKLEEKHLKPASSADRRTLIRRVTYDLIGLPPTPQEIDGFLADTNPNAYEKVVDRLLASPHYGERWARHWLDLARFAETDGHEFDFEKPNAWMYRDYVIRALNDDLPYNQFVTEQVAGDLVARPRINPAGSINESLLATTFFWFGEGKHSPVDLQVDEAERIDNQIDVFSKTFLGLSVGCARCHNHKFDAISTKDYYALSGYLKSSRYHLARIETPERFRPGVEDLKASRTQIQPLLVQSVTAAQQKGLESFEAGLLALASVPQTRQVALPDPRLASSARALPALNKYLREVAAKDPANPLYPWFRLGIEQAAEKPETFRTRANAIVADFKAKIAEAQKARAGAVVFEDFHTGDYRNWDLSGEAFGAAPERIGLQTVLTESSSRITGVMGPGVANSGVLSPRLQGEMRSHTFAISKNRILYHLAGSGVTFNLVIDGFHRIQYPIYGGLTIAVNNPKPTWYTMDVSKWVGHNAYVEVLDHGDGSAAVDRILFADSAMPASTPDPLIVQMLENPAITSMEGLTHAYRTLLATTLQTWQDDKLASTPPDADRIALLDWMLRTDNLVVAASALTPTPEMAALLKKRQGVEKALPDIHRVMAIADGSSEDDHVHIRGNYKTPGDLVPRRFFEALNGLKQPVPKEGSGRLELAQRLTAPSNPLLPRVMVNRLWMHHFGDGIVKTPDDFGIMGERPTHPELLDWLAKEFIRQGWSLKTMHRMMVTSATYRMASRSDAKSDEGDPQNRLLHKVNIRRLEAECIRDAALAVSGRMDSKLYGPSVMPYLTEFMAGRGKPAKGGPLDGDGRRSIYIGVRRNFLTPLFLAFDYPVPFTSIGRRSVSNVPAQALALMNNPLFQQQAEVWAKKTLAVPNLTPAQRIETLYIEAYGRPVLMSESADALAFLAEQDKAYGKPDDPRSWTDLCHVLFNVKEFIF